MEKKLVLIVDDEKDIQEVIQDTLEERGYCCTTASSAEEALAALSEQRFDLALLDVMMPGKSGVELFQEMSRRNLDTSVVFVTAKSDLKQAVGVMKAGALDYVLKPVDLSVLERVIVRALETRESQLVAGEAKRSLELTIAQQTQLLENRLREITALNKLLQSTVGARREVIEAMQKVAFSALQTAKILQELAEQILKVAEDSGVSS